MNDVQSLMSLAMKLVHELSERVLDLEQCPKLRQHAYFGALLADAGVCALAHVSAAQATAMVDSRTRRDVLTSLSGARGSLGEVKRLAKAASGAGLMNDESGGAITERADQAIAVLLALTVEVRGMGRGGFGDSVRIPA